VKGRVLYKEGSPLNELFFIQIEGHFRNEIGVIVPVEEAAKPVIPEINKGESALIVGCMS